MSNIILSKKHGVNPSLICCPICNAHTSIALFGQLKDDQEAPREIKGTDLCDKCKSTHITIIEVNNDKVETGRIGFIAKKHVNDETLEKETYLKMYEGEFYNIFIKE
jgi:hypothetical protein